MTPSGMTHTGMTHPGEKQLSLYGSGDLGFLDLLRMRWHLRSCSRCEEEVAAHRALSSRLRHYGDPPPGLNWDRLAAEMTANIHLGIEAGECVSKSSLHRRPERIGWRSAAVMAGVGIAVFTAWWLNPPRGRQAPVPSTQAEVRTAPGGLELKENGSALMLLHTRGRQSPVILSGSPGALRAGFVDEDTGQVTINNVYAD